MTSDELAERFEGLRKKFVGRASYRYYSIEPDILDGLYTDTWTNLVKAKFIQDIPAYVWQSFAHNIVNFIRVRIASEDIMDRGGVIDLSLVERTVFDPRSEEGVEFERMSLKVERVMERMPCTLALIGRWYYVDNWTYQQIATYLGLSQTQAYRKVKLFQEKFKAQWDLVNLP